MAPPLSFVRHKLQRQNSKQEARALQEDFLQKARDELQIFQSSSASPHRLSNASQPISRASVEEPFTSVDAMQQLSGTQQLTQGIVQQRPKTTLEARLER